MARNNQAMSDLLRYNAAMLPRKRSVFDKSHSHATTLDSAYLVPLMVDRVLPGDEKKIRYSGLARMTTPLHPTMDEANLDVWAFYVPDRLWWNHAKEFYGENKDAEFNPDGLYQMPSVKFSEACLVTSQPASERGVGSLTDYIGMPAWDVDPVSQGVDDVVPRICIGPYRSYQLIWNDYFRNSSIQPSLQLNDGDTVTYEESVVDFTLRKVCKNPDYFTTLLKEPQAGGDVLLPLGEWAPVVTRDQSIDNYGSQPLVFYPMGGSSSAKPGIILQREGGGEFAGSYSMNASQSMTTSDDTINGYLVPQNLWTDLTSATSATINNLRAAITVQHLLEVDNMAGKRYQQLLLCHFGVFTPDATLQRPELLGATGHIPIGMRQVLQTSAVSSDSGLTPLGNTAAFSLTNVTNEWICNKSFTEPGYIMVLGAIRPLHSYSQGIDPLFTKLDRYDHYWPVFDNLGNQPLYKYNLVSSKASQGNISSLSDVFGYQEAWTEYRIKNNRVSGLMRPDVPGTLATWNYTTNFAEVPSLTSEFVTEDPLLLDRTLAVQNEPQFLLDSYFDYTDIKNMSVHSVPGLTRL